MDAAASTVVRIYEAESCHQVGKLSGRGVFFTSCFLEKDGIMVCLRDVSVQVWGSFAAGGRHSRDSTGQVEG